MIKKTSSLIYLLISGLLSTLLISCEEDKGALPELATPVITEITSTSAFAIGNVTSEATITAQGVCWSTNPNPTLADSKVEGTGIGLVTSSITGLTAGTKYYLRGYATNKAGTEYSDEVEFTTLQ